MHLPATRWSERLFLWLAIAASAFALFMHAGIYSSRLSRKDWATPTSYIRANYQPGDAVALLPHWALMGAEPLRGIPVLYAEHIAREDLNRYKRLWVLRAPRLGKWWFQKSFERDLQALQRRYWKRSYKRFGPIDVSLFQLPPAPKMLYDFLSLKHLRRAEVGLETPPHDQRPPRCASKSPEGDVQWFRNWRARPGWHLGPRNYFFGRILQEIQDTPRDCLWAMPKRCQILRVRYRDVPLQGTLTIEHGIGTAAPGNVAPGIKPSGADVELTVYVEQREVRRFVVSQKQGWRKHHLDLDAYKWRYPRGSVEIAVRPVGPRAGDRPGYCFRAQLREIPEKAPRPTSRPTPKKP
ncbi:MAG: hypothetical protein H6728_11065 [Myxococcales bacterium]|nr:hypothetical protein [Myxococcales bacterium]